MRRRRGAIRLAGRGGRRRDLARVRRGAIRRGSGRLLTLALNQLFDPIELFLVDVVWEQFRILPLSRKDSPRGFLQLGIVLDGTAQLLPKFRLLLQAI